MGESVSYHHHNDSFDFSIKPFLFDDNDDCDPYQCRDGDENIYETQQIEMMSFDMNNLIDKLDVNQMNQTNANDISNKCPYNHHHRIEGKNTNTNLNTGLGNEEESLGSFDLDNLFSI